MKKFLTTTLIILGLFTATTKAVAATESGPYASIIGGASFFDLDNMTTNTTQGIQNISSDFSTGYTFGAAIGYQFCSPFRIEGEFAYRNNKIKNLIIDDEKLNNNRIDLYTYMINGYYDIRLNSPITPYLGAGLGYVNSSERITVKNDAVNDAVEVFKFKSKNSGVAAQLKAGASYAIDCKTDIGLEYYYLFAYKDATTHGVQLNLRRHF